MPCLSPAIPDTKLLFLKKARIHFVFLDQSKKDGKDLETIQSSTPPDPGYLMGK